MVYGKLKGNVRAKGQIEIKGGSSVDPDLTTAQIIMIEFHDVSKTLGLELVTALRLDAI